MKRKREESSAAQEEGECTIRKKACVTFNKQPSQPSDARTLDSTVSSDIPPVIISSTLTLDPTVSTSVPSFDNGINVSATFDREYSNIYIHRPIGLS